VKCPPHLAAALGTSLPYLFLLPFVLFCFLFLLIQSLPLTAGPRFGRQSDFAPLISDDSRFLFFFCFFFFFFFFFFFYVFTRPCHRYVFSPSIPIVCAGRCTPQRDLGANCLRVSIFYFQFGSPFFPRTCFPPVLPATAGFPFPTPSDSGSQKSGSPCLPSTIHRGSFFRRDSQTVPTDDK